MSMSPPEDPWAAKWLEILERSYQRYARREKLPEDDLQELFLEYARCVARGEAPKKLWGWADVVLRRLAARQRTLASAGERLLENLVASEGEFREGPGFLVPMHRRETWEEIRDRVMESFPAAYRKAIGIMPECSSMHEWARETSLERVDLRRIIERVAQVARGFLPPPSPLSPRGGTRPPTRTSLVGGRFLEATRSTP
jgi:hypothetical protein